MTFKSSFIASQANKYGTHHKQTKLERLYRQMEER